MALSTSTFTCKGIPVIVSDKTELERMKIELERLRRQSELDKTCRIAQLEVELEELQWMLDDLED